MSLVNLRESLWLLIGRPLSHRIDADPPEDLDTDLFVPLALTYDWKYADICADQHEAGRKVEEGSDWDGEDSASAVESEEGGEGEEE
jgi:hypothetical protein